MNTKLEQVFTKDEMNGLWRIGGVNAKIQWYNHMLIKAIQLLKQMEFCGTNINYGDCDDNWRDPYADEHVCPICGCSGYHSDSCELQELLEEAKGIK